MDTFKILKFLAMLSLTTAASVAAAGDLSAKVTSTSIQGSTVGASIEDTQLDYVPLTVTASGTNPSARARAVINYEVVYTPTPGESVSSPIYVTVGFEDTLQATNTSDSARVCDVTDGTTVVHSISPSYFAAENGGTYNLGESEVAVPVTLQTDGTWKGTFTIASNYLEATVPSGSSDIASATQGVGIVDYALTASLTPPVRQRSLSGSAGATFVKVTAIASTCTKNANVTHSKYKLENKEVKDLAGKVYSRASTQTQGNYAMYDNRGFGFSAGYVQYTCNIYTTRTATYPTSATVDWSINKATKLAASGSFADPMGSEFSGATIGNVTITANFANSTKSYAPSPSVGKPTPLSVTLDSVGSANVVLPSGSGLYVPLLSVAGSASDSGTSMSATAYHKLRLIVRVR